MTDENTQRTSKTLVTQLRERGNGDIADGYEDKTERGQLDLLAADEIEGAHKDITSLMDSLNGEVNEAERLRRALQGICNRWRAPHPRLAHETDLEAAINERDDLYALASAALAGSVHETPAFGTCSKCQQPIDSFHNINGCPSEKASAGSPLTVPGLEFPENGLLAAHKSTSTGE